MLATSTLSKYKSVTRYKFRRYYFFWNFNWLLLLYWPPSKTSRFWRNSL